MSLFLIVDDQYAGDIASNHYWREFSEWIDTSIDDTESQLLTLVEHGLSEDIDMLRTELGELPEHDDEGMQSVVTNLLTGLASYPEAEVAVISDGQGEPLADESEWDEEEAEEAVDTGDTWNVY